MLLCLYDALPNKTNILVSNQAGFQPGLKQTRLCSHRRWLDPCNFGFRKYRDCTIHLAKTKVLVSFSVTAKLICVFVFAYGKKPVSHDVAQIFSTRPEIALNNSSTL